MASILEEIFVLTHEGDYISFFNRYQGDSGRDIAAVKIAIGTAYSANLDAEQVMDASIGSMWFECGSRRPLDSEQLKKFDTKLRLDLMAFQLKHQFIMVSYYFEKYCVYEIQNNQDLNNKIEASFGLFDMEFGSIGEGTIAVLHGWRPNSVPYNHSFVTDYDKIIDEVPNQLYSLVENGTIEKPPTSIVSEVLQLGDAEYDDSSQFYLDNTHARKLWASRLAQQLQDRPYYALYKPASVGADMTESQLFVSSRAIMISPLPKDPREMLASDRYDVLSPMLEPDHLSDPDPFPIGQDEIGFFDRTGFTLENLPNFSEPDEEYIKRIEDLALTKVLAFYNKPILWNMGSDLTEEDLVSFTEQQDADAFSDNSDHFYVTTQANLNTIPNIENHHGEDSIIVKYKEDVQTINRHSPIRFVEFRTPSLRPGDVYRAYFKISKKFLDKIKTGDLENAFGPSLVSLTGNNKQILDQLSELFSSEYCIQNSNSDEEMQTKREKYKAFAMKKKLEISREMRSRSLLAATTSDPGVQIDLGVFGAVPGPLSGYLDDTSINFDDVITDAAAAGSNLLASQLPTGSAPNPLEIHLSDLEEGIDQLVSVFRSDRAKQDMSEYKMESGLPLDLETEANFLSQIPGLVRRAILGSDNFSKAVREAETNLSAVQILDEPRMGVFQDNLQGTRIKIKFTEARAPMIVKISVANKKYFSTDVVAFDLLGTNFNNPNAAISGALTRERTVNYLKNIYNIIPGKPSDWKQAAAQLVGIGSSPCSDDDSANSAGAAMIIKYTINKDGSSTNFLDIESTYKPVHNRFSDSELAKRASEAAQEVSNFYNNIDWSKDYDIPQIGPTCDSKDLFEFVNKRNMSKLLCDFFSCIRLPNINVKLPNFTLPEIPTIPIFEFPGLNMRLAEIFEALAVQFVCSIIRNLLDVLSSPFCEEQIVRDLYGAASNVSPDIQLAFAEAMVDTGIPKEKNSSASSMISDLVNFLTPREICALLQGAPVNRQVYNIVKNLASNYGLETELDSNEKVVTFFQSIGIYVPDEVCSRLAQTDNLLGIQNCKETADFLTQVRNAATHGNVSPERVAEAVTQAEKNLMDKTKAYQMMMGDFSLEDMYSEFNINHIKESPALEEMSKIAVDAALSIPKKSFLASMDAFIPALFLDVSGLVTIDDPEYDPVATMRFLRAINNLQRISNFNLNGTSLDNRLLTNYLRITLLNLCDDYEKILYTTPFNEEIEVYRSQIEGLQEPSSARENREFAEEARTEAEDGGFGDPYANVKTSLKGSIVRGWDLSDDFFAAGNLPLRHPDADTTPDGRAEASQNALYSNIWDTMFPLFLDVPKEDSTSPETIVVNSWYVFETDNRISGAEFIAGEPDSQSNFTNIALNLSYMRAINSIIQKYQNDIEETMEKVFNVVSREKLLEVIRDFYDIEAEAARDESIAQDQDLSLSVRELIDVDQTGQAQRITLEHPSDGLTKTKMFDETVSEEYIKNKTEIDDGFFLGTAEDNITTITLCEEVPQEYRDLFDEGNEEVSLRKKAFTNQLKAAIKDLYDDYRTSDQPAFTELPEFENLPNLNALDSKFRIQQTKTLEGTIEQLVSAMKDSRIFNDAAYIDRINSKLRSRSFINTAGDDICIANPQNSITSGPVNFDDLVTDFFGAQYMKELQDPANSIYTPDYSQPGAFEKAMMSTVLLGYIRIVCLEALLKGCISYSSWDIDFVSSDALFFEYMAQLIEKSIEKQSGFRDYRIFVDDAFRKITGTNNRKIAIRKILREELSGYISKLSKILFENDVDKNYYNWFLEQLPLVNAPHTKAPEEDSQWILNLKQSDIEKFRRNDFTFLERYIRTTGPFEGTLGTPADLAEKQMQALKEFIRYDSENPAYPDSFENKLHDPNDEEFLDVPIRLDIPTKEEFDSLGIDEGGNIQQVSLSGIDEDAWRNKEFWSLEDFQALLRRIFSNNAGVEKFVFHLLKKYYDPSDANWHGRPKTLRDSIPVKAIKRKRTYYRYSAKDYFSSKLSKSFEPVVEAEGNIAAQPRSLDAAIYHKYITDDDIDGIDAARRVPLGEEEKIEYNDRYYILSANGVSLFDGEAALDEHNLVQTFKETDNSHISPRRGLSPVVKDKDGNYVSFWRKMSEGIQSAEEFKMSEIKGLNEDWVDDEIRNKIIFQNKSGPQTEDSYNKFINEMGDSIEEEIWHEYVIDLVGQASPVFNQPGINNYDGSLTPNGSKIELANALEEATDYVRKNGDGTARSESQERNQLRCVAPGDEHLATIVAKNIDDGCDHNDTSGGGTKQAYIRQGIGFTSLEESIERPGQLGEGVQNLQELLELGAEGRFKSGGYAFFENDIKLKFDDSTLESGRGNYILDEKSKEVLGENEYKIPLRLLITQVSDSSGNIKQCFVRYLIPKVATFSSFRNNGGRYDDKARAVTTAAVKALKGYENFIQINFQEIAVKEGDNDKEREVLNAMRNWSKFTGRDMADGIEDPDGFAGANESFSSRNQIASSRARVINWLMGRRGDHSEDTEGVVPVLVRDRYNRLANQDSKGVAFVSREKVWSQAAQAEAIAKIDHFVVDEQENEYSNFDNFFKDDIGILLRKEQPTETNPDGINRIVESLIGPNTPATLGAESRDPGVLQDIREHLKKRYLAYSRGSKHQFYEKTVDDLLANVGNEAIKNIGNLVSWFSQRRIDGFYGATSIALRSDNFIPKGTTGGLKISPNSHAYKLEAADFDCGPSLFYGDKRILAESFMIKARSYVEENITSALIADETARANLQKQQLYDRLKAFRFQNAHKVLETVHYDISAPARDFDTPLATNGGNMHEGYKARTLRSKALTALHADARMSILALNVLLEEIQSTNNIENVRNAIFFNDLDFALNTSQAQNHLTHLNIQAIHQQDGIDTIFHNPKLPSPIKDKKFDRDGDPDIPITGLVGDSLSRTIPLFSDQIADSFNIGIDTGNIQQILDQMTERHEEATNHAQNLHKALADILFGANPQGITVLERLGIKHGIRLNLSVTSGRRIGASFGESSIPGFVHQLWNQDSQVGEEERTGVVFYEADLDQDQTYQKLVSIPLASYERPIQADPCEPEVLIRNLIPRILSRDSSMLESLSQEERFKSFYEFSIPYRRISSLLTIHGTSMLAGYNTMPSVLTSTKSSLANMFKIMAIKDNFDANYGQQFGAEFDDIALAAAMGQDFPSGGELPNCFSFDGLNGDWFKMIQEMIEQFLIYFPSVIFRGVADQLDPAYREMKSHYYACELPNLKMDALGLSAGNGNIGFGLRGPDEPKQKRYIPVNTGFTYDAAKGTARVLIDGGDYLGKAINRLVTYITEGPKQLIDATYAFQIPCMEDINGDFRNWSKYKTGEFGRYGHPLSVFTLLALPTKELPRDKEYQRRTCAIQQNQRQNPGAQIVVCSDDEE